MLYDALYGTDVISEDAGAERGGAYNPIRGDKVIAYARRFLDLAAPLASGSHDSVTQYAIVDGALAAVLKDGQTVSLATPSQCVGYNGAAAAPNAILIVHNNLHIEIQVDRSHHIGKDDSAGVKDVLIESAITTIMDCEDSVAAVDAVDKSLAYRNWVGLMKGDLQESLQKGGRTGERRRESPIQSQKENSRTRGTLTTL